LKNPGGSAPVFIIALHYQIFHCEIAVLMPIQSLGNALASRIDGKWLIKTLRSVSLAQNSLADCANFLLFETRISVYFEALAVMHPYGQ
jgi:hypothetical protein